MGWCHRDTGVTWNMGQTVGGRDRDGRRETINLDWTPVHICLPSLRGTMKGRWPRSSPSTTSRAKTTAMHGRPAGTVGGMNLHAFDDHQEIQ